MTRVISEFDPGERPQLELVRNSREDSRDQLRRARHRLERVQRRVQDLEVADDSWMLLLAQCEFALERNGSDAMVSQAGVLPRGGRLIARARLIWRPAAVRVAPDVATGSHSATCATTRVA